MAWVVPDKRSCPSCTSSARILVVQAREGGFRLSCSWCAFLSERVSAHEAFFVAWGATSYRRGHTMRLEGVPHWQDGGYVESVPIRVLNSGSTALVTVRKDTQ